MTDLEKRAEKMFNKMITFYLRDCGRNRDYAREIAIKSVIAFAQQETALLSKHILELQADKGRLTDENKTAKEIIRELIESMQPIKFEEDRQRAIAKAEAFLNKE